MMLIGDPNYPGIKQLISNHEEPGCLITAIASCKLIDVIGLTGFKFPGYGL